MADSLRPRSYIVAVSPSTQYADLDVSLEAQVIDARKNLLEDFHAVNMSTIEEPPLNLNEVGDDFLKVFLRIRPFTREELASSENKECIRIYGDTTVSTSAPAESTAYKNAQHLGLDRARAEFVFSRVFGPDVQQREIFEMTTFELVKQFVAGYSSMLFSYGVTNSGKTYTIQGPDTDPGVIPQTLNCLFAFAKDKMYNEPCFQPKLYNDTVVCDEHDKRALARKKESLLKLSELNDPDAFLFEHDMTKALSGSESSLTSSSSSVSDIHEICNVMDEAQTGSHGFTGFKYLIWVSFIEIYNEYVYDLLDPLTQQGKGKRRCTLKLSEDKTGNIYIKNLTEIPVNSCEEALKLLTFGQKNLRFAATKLNYNSSRSHCVYSLRLMRLAYRNGKITVEKTSKFSFCDLAGSERTSKTGSTGERSKEAGNINTSLLNLGRCINTLRYNQAHRDKVQIIPFRDSKLTRLFQNFLVGRGKACMIVNVSQCASSFDETLQVLQFSALVKQVKQVRQREIPEAPVSITITTAAQQSALPVDSQVDRTIEQASYLPLEEGEEADDEFSVFDTTIGADNQLVQKYQTVIDDLRGQLLEERKKCLRIERQVREELCEKFALQMQEMTENYAQYRREDRQDAEDEADERIEMYIQTVKKQRRDKDRRVTLTPNENDGDEEGWVPETLLAAERLKTEKNEQLIKELQQKLAESQSGSGSDAKMDVDKPESTSEWEEPGPSSLGKEEELRHQLEKKIKECQDLEEMLNEAGETYKMNEKEINELKSRIAALEDDKANVLRCKDERILELENILQKTTAEVSTAVRTAEDEDRVQQAVEGSDNQQNRQQPLVVEEIQRPSSALTIPAAEMETAETTSDDAFKLIELESKIFDLEKQIESLTQEKGAAAGEYQRLKDEMTAMLDERQKFEAKILDLEKQLSHKTQIALSSGQLRTQLQKAESKVEDLEKQLKELSAKENKLKHDKRKVEDELKQKAANFQNLEKTLNDVKREKIQLTQSVEENEAKVKKLESQAVEMENALRDVSASKDELKEKVKELEEERNQESKAYEEAISEKMREIFELKSASEISAVTERELKDMCNQYRTNLERKMSEVDQLKQEFDNAEKSAQKSAESLQTLQTNFESLKDSFEKTRTSLSDKKQKVEELERLNREADQKMDELKNELTSKEQIYTNTFEKLRIDLNTANESIIELKKEKLQLTENVVELEENLKSCKIHLIDIEKRLQDEKANNERIMQDSQQNETLIEWYKNAIASQDEVQQKLQEALSGRSEEIAALNNEIQNLRSRLETTENNVSLRMKENNRLSHELEIRKEAETKLQSLLKNTEDELQRLKADLLIIQENHTQQETRFYQQASEESERNQRLLDEIKTKVEYYENIVKTLSKEITDKDDQMKRLSKEITDKNSLIDGLTQRFARKERDLFKIESEISKLEITQKDTIAEKDNQIQALQLHSDTLMNRLSEAENVHEIEIQRLGESIADKDALILRLSENAAVVSPVPGVRRNNAENRRLTDEESVTEVELTPMVTKKSQTSGRNSKKTEVSSVGSLKSYDSMPSSTSFLSQQPVRKKSRGRPRKVINPFLMKTIPNTDTTLGPTEMFDTAATSTDTKKPPRAPSYRSKRVKTVAVLTEENSPVSLDDKEFGGSTAESAVDPTSSGRLARRAKSTARNGIFAVTEYLRNSPGASSTGSAPTASGMLTITSQLGESSNQTGSQEPAELTNDTNDQNLPLKKRKRTLYRSPSAITLTPEKDFDAGVKPTSETSTARKKPGRKPREKIQQ